MAIIIKIQTLVELLYVVDWREGKLEEQTLNKPRIKRFVLQNGALDKRLFSKRLYFKLWKGQRNPEGL